MTVSLTANGRRTLVTPQWLMRQMIMLLHAEFNVMTPLHAKAFRLWGDTTLVLVKCGGYETAVQFTIEELEWLLDDITDKILRPVCQQLAFKIWANEPPTKVDLSEFGALGRYELGTESYYGED